MADIKDLPTEFIERARLIFPHGLFSKIIKEGYLLPKIPTARLNLLKGQEELVFRYFQKEKIRYERDRFLENCYYFPDLSHRKVLHLKPTENGEIYLQNLSSQIPPYILNPQSSESVLDLCASPGSKTTLMASLMSNTGSIEACEPDFIRFERLKKNCEHLGAHLVTCHQRRGEGFCKEALESQNFFDKILADVPCSGDGTFYANDRASFVHWSEDFVKKTAKLQSKLLKSALHVLKPQGTLVYSTCSISPEENEAVVHDVLNEFSQLKLVDIRQEFKSSLFAPALKSWHGQIFHPEIHKCLRLYPSQKTEGFFVAKFVKSEV